MNCPKCGGGSKVLISCLGDDNTYLRRRMCKACGYRFNTEERISDNPYLSSVIHETKNAKYRKETSSK